MANTKSAAKRARQTVRKTEENRRVLTGIKTQLKKTRAALGTDLAVGKTEATKLASTLDKAVKSGRIHKNAANRTKSRIQKAINAKA
jgi:small subunit ribosomal protein S20